MSPSTSIAFAESAIALNVEANDVYVDVVVRDMLDDSPAPQPRYDVILVGDLFYERDTAARTLAFLDRHARSRHPRHDRRSRPHLFRRRIASRKLAEYSVPVTRELEDMEIKRTSVWELV